MITNKNEYQNFINNNEEIKGLFIESKTCNVCHAVYPKVLNLFNEYNINLESLDIYYFNEISSILNVFSVPVLIIFYNNKEVFRMDRFFVIEDIKKFLDKIKA